MNLDTAKALYDASLKALAEADDANDAAAMALARKAHDAAWDLFCQVSWGSVSTDT